MSKVESLEEEIIKTIRSNNPNNCEELINIITNKNNVNKKTVINTLFNMEDKGKIIFGKIEIKEKRKIKDTILSNKFYPYYLTILVIISTIFFNYGYMRYVLGAIYLLILPGYWFIKCINLNNISKIKLLPMSMGISLSITAIIGLILNYTVGIHPLSIIAINTMILEILLIISFMKDHVRSHL